MPITQHMTQITVTQIITNINNALTRHEAQEYLDKMISKYPNMKINIYAWFSINNALYSKV